MEAGAGKPCPALSGSFPSAYGECQAALPNLEELITSESGIRYALAEQLAVSLQLTRAILSEKKKAARGLHLVPRGASKNTSKRSTWVTSLSFMREAACSRELGSPLSRDRFLPARNHAA